jgi:hypothetical protein
MKNESPSNKSDPRATNPPFGAQLAIFRGRNIKSRTWILVFIPGIIAAIFSTIYGTILAKNAYLQYGPALAIMRAQPWYLLAAGLLIFLVPYFVFCLLVRLEKFVVYEEGFTIRNFFFHHQTYLWSEISGITATSNETTFLSKDLRTLPTGTIYLQSGKQIHLANRFQEIPDLIKFIKHKIYPLLWPPIKSNFRLGQEIHFGRINLDQRQISVSEQKISWSAIECIKISSGNLVVELRDKFMVQVPIENIQNLELFFKIIDWGISA